MGTTERYAEAKRIFLEAGRLPDAERAGFVSAQCGKHSALEEQVRRLLMLDESQGAFLQTPALGEHGSIREGMSLGRFRVVRVLGEGGMGIVYEAEENEPQRRVALKVIRPGFFSERLRSRFRHEIRVLGQLRHPGIAQIYEAGTLEVGGERVPYFAMELVEGPALLGAAQERGLGTRERLLLMAQVCDAVHHAHQKGVIHRDLKPGNILVEGSGSTESARQSGAAVPLQVKILDFGIALATDADLLTVTMQTDPGQLVGTIPYMSPEQATADPGGVDIRSDVYSIGVVAFELLSGRLPYAIHGKGLPEAARAIREDAPESLGSISRALRGDVETIIAKALEKDRERRYGSAADMAADIRRYLRDEPISARPPSALYQLRSYARRHKPVVAAAAAVALALVAGTLVSVYFAVREHGARVLAVREGETAQRQVARVQRINEFLVDDLFFAGGKSANDPDARLVDFLDAAVPQIGARFADDPLMEAHLRALVAQMYLHMGRYQAGLALVEPAVALGEKVDDPLKLQYLDDINLAYGLSLNSMGRLDEAEKVLRTLLTHERVLNGPRMMGVKGALAATLVGQRRYGEAEPLLLEATAHYRVQLPQRARNYFLHKSQLAPIYYSTERYEEVRALCEEMIGEIETHTPDDHQAMSTALFWRTRAYARLGRHDEAADAAVRLADYAIRVMESGHPNIGMAQISAAQSLSQVGRHQEAEERALDANTRIVATFGARHFEAERMADFVSRLYKGAGKDAEYRQWRTRYLVLRYYVAGPKEAPSLDSTFKAGADEFGADVFADRLEAECVQIREDPGRARFYANAAWSLAAHGRTGKAEALLVEASECSEADSRPEEVKRAVRDRLPALLERLGRGDDAERWRGRLGG